MRKFRTAPVVSDTRWNASRRCAACCFARSLSTSLTPPRSPYANIAGTKGFTYGHTPSSSSLVISPQRSACPTSCSEASDTSPPTNRRFATVRPVSSKKGRSLPLRTGIKTVVSVHKSPHVGLAYVIWSHIERTISALNIYHFIFMLHGIGAVSETAPTGTASRIFLCCRRTHRSLLCFCSGKSETW